MSAQQDEDRYEPPALTMLGTVSEFTLGSGDDTAELKTAYW